MMPTSRQMARSRDRTDKETDPGSQGGGWLFFLLAFWSSDYRHIVSLWKKWLSGCGQGPSLGRQRERQFTNGQTRPSGSVLAGNSWVAISAIELAVLRLLCFSFCLRGRTME